MIVIVTYIKGYERFLVHVVKILGKKYCCKFSCQMEEKRNTSKLLISELFLSRCYEVDLRVVNKKIG